MVEILITSSSYNWVVPDDWTSVNSIEIVGAGGGGGNAVARDNYTSQIKQFRNYSRGGAGGGYAKVENVTILQPRQVINCGAGQGGLKADPLRFFMPPDGPMYLSDILAVTGRPGGFTYFGSYMSVFGGRYLLEYMSFPKLYSHIGGSLNFSNWPNGSYTSLVTANGEDKRYTSGNSAGDLYVDISNPLSFGGAAGGPNINGAGQGGQGMTLIRNYSVWGNRFGSSDGINPAEITKDASSGADGVIRIRYEPSGTQQACVWIS